MVARSTSSSTGDAGCPQQPSSVIVELLLLDGTIIAAPPVPPATRLRDVVSRTGAACPSDWQLLGLRGAATALGRRDPRAFVNARWVSVASDTVDQLGAVATALPARDQQDAAADAGSTCRVPVLAVPWPLQRSLLATEALVAAAIETAPRTVRDGAAVVDAAVTDLLRRAAESFRVAAETSLAAGIELPPSAAEAAEQCRLALAVPPTAAAAAAALDTPSAGSSVAPAAMLRLQRVTVAVQLQQAAAAIVARTRVARSGAAAAAVRKSAHSAAPAIIALEAARRGALEAEAASITDGAVARFAAARGQVQRAAAALQALAAAEAQGRAAIREEACDRLLVLAQAHMTARVAHETRAAAARVRTAESARDEARTQLERALQARASIMRTPTPQPQPSQPPQQQLQEPQRRGGSLLSHIPVISDVAARPAPQRQCGPSWGTGTALSSSSHFFAAARHLPASPLSSDEWRQRAMVTATMDVQSAAAVLAVDDFPPHERKQMADDLSARVLVALSWVPLTFAADDASCMVFGGTVRLVAAYGAGAAGAPTPQRRVGCIHSVLDVVPAACDARTGAAVLAAPVTVHVHIQQWYELPAAGGGALAAAAAAAAAASEPQGQNAADAALPEALSGRSDGSGWFRMDTLSNSSPVFSSNREGTTLLTPPQQQHSASPATTSGMALGTRAFMKLLTGNRNR